MVGEGRHILPEIFGQADPVGEKFARSASAVARSKKSSINTNRKSTTRFQWA